MTQPGAAWSTTPTPARLLPSDLACAAQALGCATRALSALMSVEAAGRGFDPQGRLLVLYEPHVMDRQLYAHRPLLLAQARKAGLSYPVWGTHPYPPEGDARWVQIDAAMALDVECACRATSFGLGQVLGEGYAALGYSSALALAQDARVSEARQLAQIVLFIGKHGLAGALQRMDWRALAAGYNGLGAVDAYAARLARAYALTAPPGAQQVTQRPSTAVVSHQQSFADDSAAALNDAELARITGGG